MVELLIAWELFSQPHLKCTILQSQNKQEMNHSKLTSLDLLQINTLHYSTLFNCSIDNTEKHGLTNDVFEVCLALPLSLT